MAIPAKPEMPILRETSLQIYARIAERATQFASAQGLPVPDTTEGGLFYDFWYPLALEFEDFQILLEFYFTQMFPIFATEEYLDYHAPNFGLSRNVDENDEQLRNRIVTKASSALGTGRLIDYENLARNVAGVGNTTAVEKARNDVSIDLYLTDTLGQPADLILIAAVQEALEPNRIACHDLYVTSAQPVPISVSFVLEVFDITKKQETIDAIRKNIEDYFKVTKEIKYNFIGAFIIVENVKNYTNLQLNSSGNDISIEPFQIATLDLVVL